MADLMQGIHEHLTSDGDVNGVISGKCFSIKVPASVSAPFQVIQRVGGHRLLGHDGPTELEECRIMVKSAATSVETVRELASFTRDALNGLNENIGSTGGIEVRGLRLDIETDGWDPEAEVYVITQQYVGFHRDQNWST